MFCFLPLGYITEKNISSQMQHRNIALLAEISYDTKRYHFYFIT